MKKVFEEIEPQPVLMVIRNEHKSYIGKCMVDGSIVDNSILNEKYRDYFYGITPQYADWLYVRDFDSFFAIVVPEKVIATTVPVPHCNFHKFKVVAIDDFSNQKDLFKDITSKWAYNWAYNFGNREEMKQVILSKMDKYSGSCWLNNIDNDYDISVLVHSD